MFKDKNFENFLNDKITDYSQIGKYAGKQDITQGKNLDNLAWISVWIASKEQVRALSYWEVLISETINYRTQRPERGWLFCEQIFWPRKNYECACGKYKRIRYKWVICERCGVEVTTSQVRRQRAGHIELAAPIAHIWYLKSVPSRIGLLLDISVKKLEQVIYFASYIITDVFEDKKQESLRDLDTVYKSSKIDLQKKIQQTINEAKLKVESKEMSKKDLQTLENEASKQLDWLDAEYNKLKWLLKELRESTVIGELDYRIMYEKFPHVFKWGTWAQHIRVLLERIDLKKFIAENQTELKSSPKSKQKKILQKLKLASNLFKSGQRPEFFILEAIQILPPDLRPMIQLDGWRYASSDLNDLYRRVINRNNRLRKLSELGAPEVILKNEKRMLQEAVDMLINGDVRSNRPWFTNASKKKLKSLAEVLKGKQGRFRQNLLGKRVDYSGRSVIVVGPNLWMNECGLPKIMALTLFKPFVIGRLIENEIAYNVKHAEKVIEEKGKEVWDALDEVIEGKHVLLNRAPTLHRLGIQAFKPVLIEWKAIQLHPLCCTAFNADFDWDQMAVHLPLTQEAQKEAEDVMITSKNMLNPSNGEPIVAPSQDMLLGTYYLTKMVWEDVMASFISIDDAICAYEQNAITLHSPINVRILGKVEKTTLWRLFFNEIVPPELGFINETLAKWVVKKILARSFDIFGSEKTAFFSDRIKNIGFKYATISWLSISKDDMMVPSNKEDLIKWWEEKIKWIQKKFWTGFLTEKERYEQSVKVWTEVKNIIEKEMPTYFLPSNHIHHMIASGARGNWWNVTQLCWMKWLVASPTGKIIELPIKANYKEWLSVLEYFINTHSWRKGKADTALKTAQSGYLTRRLVDAAQNILVRDNDCGTVAYEEIHRNTHKLLFKESFEDKIYGKFLARDVVVDGKVLVPSETMVDKDMIAMFKDKWVNTVAIRSILTCETEGWVCQKCYGIDLGYNNLVVIGTPVGIIAAQSIWEPGTQLTMRTFHSGWVAKEGWDITAGLTRVEELFEARSPKYEAIVAPFTWTVTELKFWEKEVSLVFTAEALDSREYYIPDETYKVLVKKWDKVDEKQVIAKSADWKIKIQSVISGKIDKLDANVIVVKDVEPQTATYGIEFGKNILVSKWSRVEIWDKITEWHINIQKLMELAGPLKTQSYIVNDIKEIYSSQGQTVNSKHIELIVRQMFSKIKITNAWDTSFFPWDIADIIRFKKENGQMARTNGKQAIGSQLLLGLTKISLFTESWLSAASFQETVRVLVEASVSRKIDTLDGLKENVIIGRLIPTLKYYNNNKNVGSFYEDEAMEAAEMRAEKGLSEERSYEDYASLN
ncbi:MAG: DNA-directed RNA polymerase subunit beta' [uncultured bacterium (gcode 4)]|uniref:DNA-directed RNA polymerase subunit beta' n=1 Tax=uncultured bacterium (gcode 4) TaxID=1234023 RepID=K2H2D1_9BACT|nr:MAG: DNA-directed RNA polymerase subunit beta' [uncultured bacterium (gcode 4)]